MAKRCQCTPEKKGICRHCSSFKLVINLRKGYHTRTNFKGEPLNPVWYSMLKEDKKGPEGVFQMMLGRIMKSHYRGKFHTLELRQNDESGALLLPPYYNR